MEKKKDKICELESNRNSGEIFILRKKENARRRQAEDCEDGGCRKNQQKEATVLRVPAAALDLLVLWSQLLLGNCLSDEVH